MDAKSLGKIIYTLRKKNGLTQIKLAELLSVSDKAISKWESGAGFPDITLLPKLAEVFSTSVDYLLFNDRRGITIAGNFIVDNLCTIDGYPERGRLCNVIATDKAVGGCAPNTSIDLATIDKNVPVSVIGRVGDDEDGRFIVSSLSVKGIDTSAIKITNEAKTANCSVMNDGKERTFFSYSGANALFSPDDVNLNLLTCTILHIGYVNLLEKFDAPDENYGTVMARFLKSVRDCGVKTSIDTVSSEDKSVYAKNIIPVLKYVDYFIVNEIECCATFGKKPYRADGSLDVDAIKYCMNQAIKCGVNEKVIVHCKECGFCLDKSGNFTTVGSLIIPQELIKSNVGAGDAFCAGCLYSIYNGESDEDMLKFASASAACNLFSIGSVGGAQSKKEILKLEEKFTRRTIRME